MAQQLKDRFQRQFYYLRLSVTDVCNFKCQYCLPDGYHPNGRRSFLTLAEIERVVAAFAACGTNKIRLTGGEPSMRRDFTDIIAATASHPDIDIVATTTNGYRLKDNAQAWRDAGLSRINVSIDSLDPRQFALITGQDRFRSVMEGIDAAFTAGFDKVKVNTVLLKSLNSHEIGGFLEWIRTRPIQLRFIELMQTGEMDKFFQRYHQSGQAIKQQLIEQGWQLRERSENDGPAQVFYHPDYLGEIGLILPYESGFCLSCNRLRISALGKLHLCLFGEGGIDLRDLLQQDAQQAQLIAQIQSSLQQKAQTHYLHEGNTGATPHLASIGG
uniref:GTP 3',8-cyclase MoaA n=1 Tax=Thaumasiovibrio occultus TaxID=1891184 RepID=UPI000B357EA2|nr:GTP 3',8-cyclase MoaA [Thaumasiovibrio occultus]